MSSMRVTFVFAIGLVFSLLVSCSQVHDTTDKSNKSTNFDHTPRPSAELENYTDFLVEVEPGLYVDGNTFLADQDQFEGTGELSPQFDKDFTEANLRIRTNILDQFDDVIKIELNFIGRSVSTSDPEYAKWVRWTTAVVKEWLSVVSIYKKLPPIIVGRDLSGEDLDINVRYEEGRSKYIVPVWDWSLRTDYRIQLYETDGKHRYSTLLHEFGHAVGLFDTYGGSPCTPGNPSAVMCQTDSVSGWARYSMQDLSADDVRGVRNRFCRINDVCSEPQLNHRFGDSGGKETVEYCQKGTNIYPSPSFWNHESKKFETESANRVKNLVGLDISWGRSQIDSIRELCALTSESYSSANRGATYGSRGPSSSTFVCNSGAYVKEMRFDRYSSDPESVQVVCSDGKTSRIFGKQTSMRYKYACPNEYLAAKGLSLSYDSDVDAIGLVCGVPNGALFRTYNSIR